MGGLASGLLGGSKPKGVSTNEVSVPSWLDSQNRTLVDRAVGASNQAYTPYTGNRVADFNADNILAFDKIRQNQGKYSGLIDQASTGLNNLFGRVNGPTTEQIQAGMNPYLDSVLGISKRNAIENFQTQDSSQRRREGLIGSFGGSRVALGQMQRQKDIAQQLADMETLGRSEAYNQSLNQFNTGTQNLMAGIQGSLQTAQTGQDMDYNDIINLLKSGELQRGQSQQEEDFNYEQFDREQAYPYEQVNFLANILNPLTSAYRGGTTTQTTKGGGGSSVGQLIGTGLSIASLFSDERVKENIKEVGKLDNGFSVYSYNYKGSPKTMLGLMAQEVEKKNPDAVGEVGGIKTVDYNKATKKFASGGPVDKPSREQNAKQYTPYQFSPFNFTSPAASGGDSGGGNPFGGMDMGMMKEGAGVLGDLFGGGGGGITSMLAPSSTAAGAAGLSYMFAEGGPVGYAEGGDVFLRGMMDARKTYDEAEKRRKQVSEYYTPENPDISFAESTLRGLAATAGQLPPMATQGVAKIYENANRGMANIFSRPSELQKVISEAPEQAAPANDKDASMMERIKGMTGGLPEIGGAPNMPPTEDGAFEQYREEMRRKNQEAVYGQASDLPEREVAELNSPVPLSDNVRVGSAPMPSFLPEQRTAPTEDDDGMKLFGRKVNMPLLMAGLAMLGTEGNFGEQIAAGAKAGVSTYQAGKADKAAKEKAQYDRSREQNKDYLDYMKAMAYINQVEKQGSMTPYQKAMLEIARYNAETARKRAENTDSPLDEIKNPLDNVAIDLLKNSDILLPPDASN